MIITARNRIPFLWIVLATLPWVAVVFKEKVMAIAFTLSMRKWVENPAALTFVLTVPLYISWIVPPMVNFIADRVWTRWGRRKPFIVTSWVGTIASIACMPLAPDFGWLLAAFIAFCVFNDLGGPVEGLKMEIVPPAQRATSQAVFSWIAQVSVLVFWGVAIGRYNEMTTMFGMLISGERALFWSVSIGMVVMLLFLMLGIKETNPHSALRKEPFSVRNVFKGLFHAQLWPVYILAFSVAILGTGLGAFDLLLTTEQWGYTTQQLGTNVVVGGILNLFLIPTFGLLANRVGRAKVYVWLVIAGIILNVARYLYYNFVLYDNRPTLIEMIVFGEMFSVVGILTAMSLIPFQYDFIPRNEMGTYAAGSGLVQRGTNILTTSLMGLFVWGYATLFLGPAGEMARISARTDLPTAQVQAALNKARWNDSATDTPVKDARLTARAWYATGASLNHGRGFEIRIQNQDSNLIREQRDRLENERGKYRSRRGYAQNRAAVLTGKSIADIAASQPTTAPATAPSSLDAIGAGKFADALLIRARKATDEKLAAARKIDDKVARFLATAEAEGAGETILDSGIKRLDKLLSERAERFGDQVKAALGDILLRDGDQVLAAAVVPAVIVSFPLKSRPDAELVEQALEQVRKAEPTVIDLRVQPAAGGWATTLSAMLNSDEPATVVRRLQVALGKTRLRALQQESADGPAVSGHTAAQAVQMDLQVIEDPLDRHASPITRAVETILSVIVDPPTPERRLNALGRGLRRGDIFEHACARVMPRNDHGLRLTVAVPELGAATRLGSLPEKVDPAPDAVRKRLGELMTARPEALTAAADLYALAVPAAKEQRMTVVRPVLMSGFAKQQYDYLHGYIAIFVLQMVGLGITFMFLYLVKTGRVRRRGAEEAEAGQ